MSEQNNKLIHEGFWTGLLVSLFSLSIISGISILAYSVFFSDLLLTFERIIIRLVIYVFLMFTLSLIPGLVISKIKKYNKQQKLEFMTGYGMATFIELIPILLLLGLS